jgi:hypothetical protein
MVKSDGMRMPVFPCIRVSWKPPSCTDMTGIPHAILSTATEPKFSSFPTQIDAVAEAIRLAIFISLVS